MSIQLNSKNRLPISHPEYQYLPSKNPYSAKIKSLHGLAFTDHDTETHRGNWRSFFPHLSPNCELYVEIGCNAGHVIVEWAQQNPNRAYIGIDWKFKPIHRAAEKAKERGLKNILFFRAHAERIHHMFGPAELDRIHLFFPDPWPKKAQQKNRFFTPERLQLIAPLLKENGVFHVKTDHRGYFDSMLETAEQMKQSWKVLEMSKNLHQDHPAPYTLQIPEVTLFERIFIREGLPIHCLKISPIKPSQLHSGLQS